MTTWKIIPAGNPMKNHWDIGPVPWGPKVCGVGSWCPWRTASRCSPVPLCGILCDSPWLLSTFSSTEAGAMRGCVLKNYPHNQAGLEGWIFASGWSPIWREKNTLFLVGVPRILSHQWNGLCESKPDLLPNVINQYVSVSIRFNTCVSWSVPAT